MRSSGLHEMLESSMRRPTVKNSTEAEQNAVWLLDAQLAITEPGESSEP